MSDKPSRHQYIVEPVSTWTDEQLQQEQAAFQGILLRREDTSSGTYRKFLNEILAEQERREQESK